MNIVLEFSEDGKRLLVRASEPACAEVTFTKGNKKEVNREGTFCPFGDKLYLLTGPVAGAGCKAKVRAWLPGREAKAKTFSKTFKAKKVKAK